METVAKQIQNKILTAVETIRELPSQVAADNKPHIKDLIALGFTSCSDVVEHSTVTEALSNLEKETDFKNWLNGLLINPEYKVVTYGNLMRIIEKYHLFIAHSSNYLKEIPKFAAEKVIKHSKLKRSKGLDCNLFNWGDYRYNHERSKPTYFICAPIADFKPPICAIGRELCYDDSCKKESFRFKWPSMDPIIVSPLISKEHGVLLLDIVAAWDREASDPEIVNELQN